MVAAGGIEGEGADQPGGSEDGELVAAGDDEDGLSVVWLADSDGVALPAADPAVVDSVEAGQRG